MSLENDPWNVSGEASDSKSGSSSYENSTAVVSAEQNVKSNSKAGTNSDDLGTASLVFGILSLVLGGFVWNILGLVFGIISSNRKKNGHATAGIICSLISLALVIIAIVAIIVLIVVFGSDLFTELADELYYLFDL
ncbi:MAG: DUF4190 domain-containing protein [Treponema sp.]